MWCGVLAGSVSGLCYREEVSLAFLFMSGFQCTRFVGIRVLYIFVTDTSIKAVKILTFKPRNFLDIWTWEQIEEGCDRLEEKGAVSCWPVVFFPCVSCV